MIGRMLNLGCGSDYKDSYNWINVDVTQWPGYHAPDVYWDARSPALPFATETIPVVHMGHLLLHLAPNYHKNLIQEVYRVLAPGGAVNIVEVNMPRVFLRWLYNSSDHRCGELIWGEQGDVHGKNLAEYDKHCWGYSPETLIYFLASSGFERVTWLSDNSNPEIWWEMNLNGYKPDVK